MRSHSWRTALLAPASFPTGGRAVTSDGIDPRGSLLASWDPGAGLGLDANLGAAGPTHGVGLDRAAPDFSIGLGVAWRLLTPWSR